MVAIKHAKGERPRHLLYILCNVCTVCTANRAAAVMPNARGHIHTAAAYMYFIIRIMMMRAISTQTHTCGYAQYRYARAIWI